MSLPARSPSLSLDGVSNVLLEVTDTLKQVISGWGWEWGDVGVMQVEPALWMCLFNSWPPAETSLSPHPFPLQPPSAVKAIQKSINIGECVDWGWKEGKCRREEEGWSGSSQPPLPTAALCPPPWSGQHPHPPTPLIPPV